MASPVRSNPEVLGQASGAPSSAKRYSTAPNGKAVPFALEPFVSLHMPQKRKRDLEVLTPNYTDSSFMDSIDLKALHARLAQDPAIANDRDAFYLAVRDCMKDSESELIEFSNVTQRHLNHLGLEDPPDIDFAAKLVEKAKNADSPPNTISNSTTLKSFREHFNVSKTSSCRWIIEQYLAAAVTYAQGLIDTDTRLKQNLVSQSKIPQPQLAVFTAVPIPRTRITCGDRSVAWSWNPYARSEQDTLRNLGGEKLVGDDGSRGTDYCASFDLLAITNRDSFTGALTNGTLWRFFVAHGVTANVRIYTSAELESDKDQGLIIELLKDMMLDQAGVCVAFK